MIFAKFQLLRETVMNVGPYVPRRQPSTGPAGGGEPPDGPSPGGSSAAEHVGPEHLILVLTNSRQANPNRNVFLPRYWPTRREKTRKGQVGNTYGGKQRRLRDLNICSQGPQTTHGIYNTLKSNSDRLLMTRINVNDPFSASSSWLTHFQTPQALRLALNPTTIWWRQLKIIIHQKSKIVDFLGL